MKLVRFTPAAFALLVAPMLASCEPSDDMPPPATARQVAGAGQDDIPPAPQPAAASTDGTSSSADYASGEYTIGADTDSYDDNDPAALTDFHGTLDPYGAWVDDGTYGTVWVPSSGVVGPDFVPYATAGHWVYDDDWIWVSDYPWGWAPFHYGRWVFIEGRGWGWVPGRVYRGAWVSWGVDDGYTYLGWYPMAPAFVWFGGVAVVYPVYVGPRWVYCPRGEVFVGNVGARVIAGPAAGRVAGNVRPYVPATPGVAGGPPPQRLGYSAAQIPHPTGAVATNLQQARSFARPSTAQSIGGSSATRVAAPAARPAAGQFVTRPPITRAPAAVQRVPQGPVSARPVAPNVAPAPVYRATPAPGFRPRSSAPAPHFSGGGGGGHHR
jgi:hypothetical protein